MHQGDWRCSPGILMTNYKCRIRLHCAFVSLFCLLKTDISKGWKLNQEFTDRYLSLSITKANYIYRSVMCLSIVYKEHW